MQQVERQIKYGGDFKGIQSQLSSLGIKDPDLLIQAEQIATDDPEGIININQHITGSRASIKADFVITYLDSLNMLAEMNIKPTEMRIIAYILKAMEFGNLINLSQKQICDDLEMKKANVSRIFKSLREKTVLVEHNGHTYINSNLFAKGLSHRMDQDRREHLKNASDTSIFPKS